MLRNLLSVAVLAALSPAAVGCSTTAAPVDAAADAAADAPVEAGVCSPACAAGRACCGGRCVNPANDPLNCGACGVVCSAVTPFCGESGRCIARPCAADASTCAGGTTCCGNRCCDATQICCDPQGPLDMGPVCVTATGSPPTCPLGCAPLCISDRNVKRDIVPVDDLAVLDRVARMPVSSWSYRFDDPSVRHIGPMAQDFHAAFGLGRSDRVYDPIDAHGVTFAAIRGLVARLDDQAARLARLEAENARLRAARRR